MAAAIKGAKIKNHAAKPLNKTLKVKVGGVEKRFTKVDSCSRLKKDATKKLESLRADGFTARMKQDPSTKNYCVFKGAKKKKPAKRIPVSRRLNAG